MAERSVQPPAATGGGGYNFESYVGAWYLVHLLIGHPPFDAALGAPRRVAFQTGVDGWPLDDLLIDLAEPLGARAMITVKLNSRELLTRHGFVEDFARACWDAVFKRPDLAFDPAIDIAVMATTPLAQDLRRALDGIVQRAIASPAELFERANSTRGWVNKLQKKLLASFAKPAISAAVGHEADVGRVLRSVRVQEFDFTRPDSRAILEAVRLLSAFLDLSPEAASTIWSATIEVAASLRSESGSLTAAELRQRLERGNLPDLPAIRTAGHSQAERYRPDELPGPPTAEELQDDSEVLEQASIGLDASEPIGMNREAAIAVVASRINAAWLALERAESNEPPWDGSLQIHIRANNAGQLDAILRNTGATSAVVTSFSLTVLRDYWLIAGLLKPSAQIQVAIDDLRTADRRRVELDDPIEVLPNRAERLLVDTASARALLLRLRVYYNGESSSVAKNIALYDAADD